MFLHSLPLRAEKGTEPVLLDFVKETMHNDNGPLWALQVMEDKGGKDMHHLITAVEPDSAACRAGFRDGDLLVNIDGQEIIDEIDYQAFIAKPRLTAEVLREGKARRIKVRKEEYEPLGLHFGESMTLSPRTCRNKCVFCFIDQMPPKLRDTLQAQLNALPEDCELILFAMAYCGGAMDGLTSKTARLAAPRFDDCIRLLLSLEPEIRNGADSRSLYFNRQWLDSDRYFFRIRIVLRQTDCCFWEQRWRWPLRIWRLPASLRGGCC